MSNCLCKTISESIEKIIGERECWRFTQGERDDDKLRAFLKNASIEEWAEYLREDNRHCSVWSEMYSYIPMELFWSKAEEDWWFKQFHKAEYLEDWGNTDIFSDSEDDESDDEKEDDEREKNK